MHDIQAVITYVRIKQTNNIYAPITFYLQKHLMGTLDLIHKKIHFEWDGKCLDQNANDFLNASASISTIMMHTIE